MTQIHKTSLARSGVHPRHRTAGAAWTVVFLALVPVVVHATPAPTPAPTPYPTPATTASAVEFPDDVAVRVVWRTRFRRGWAGMGKVY